MDGITLLQKVRNFNKEIPFIFLSGFPSTDTMAKALQLGAFDFFPKPISKGFEKRVKCGLNQGLKIFNREMVDKEIENEEFMEENG